MKGSPSYVALYHYPCADGGLAAYAVHLALGAQVTFVRYDHRAPPSVDSLPRAENLFLLDCAGPSAAWLVDACRVYSHVHLIDHHKTAHEMILEMDAQEIRPDNLHTDYFSMKQSGCMLALEGLGMHEPDLPNNLFRIFQYVGDNDTWTHALPESKAFSAGLSLLNVDFDFTPEHREATVKVVESLCFDTLLASGREELVRRAKLIAHYETLAECYTLGGVAEVLGVRIASKDWAITSALGERLAVKSWAGIGAIFNEKEGRVSLRSILHDTTSISKQYGGGGHGGASGFMLTLEQWEAAREKDK